jgi:hypothetical protein
VAAIGQAFAWFEHFFLPWPSEREPRNYSSVKTIQTTKPSLGVPEPLPRSPSSTLSAEADIFVTAHDSPNGLRSDVQGLRYRRGRGNFGNPASQI